MNLTLHFPKRFVITWLIYMILFLASSGPASPGLYSQEASAAPTGSQEKTLMVMPFKVNPAEEKTNQWLGRAVSYYLIAGLQANNLDVLPDMYTTSILEVNHILFPYSVSKAGIMNLARKYRLDYAVWGEITLEKIDSRDNENHTVNGSAAANANTPEPSTPPPTGADTTAKDEPPSEDVPTEKAEPTAEDMIDSVGNNQFHVQLNAFIIDLDNYSQKYLPVIKGHINDLYQIKDELLTAVVRSLNPQTPAQDIRYPDFGLNPRNYELFIKSLLIKDKAKRIRLLEKVKNATAGADCDLLNFELAALSYDNGDLEAAAALLEKIPANKENPQLLFPYKKDFLTGLIAYAGENIPGAEEAFTRLKQEGRYPFEVHHNLGVIRFKQKDYKAARAFFQQALAERKDPATWLYLIYALLFDNETTHAVLELKQALRLYPREEKPVQLLAYFITQDQEKDLLFPVFQDYIPSLYLTDKLPGLTLRLKNPFRLQLAKPYSAEEPGDPEENGNAAANDDIDGAIERLQGLLEMNPYEPEHYRAITLLYLEKKEYREAEMHAAALVFLENTDENNLLLAKVYKAMGNKKKAKEIKNRAVTRR